MGLVLVQLVMKLVTLAGAVTQTVGFLTFFTLESLLPYRWPLLLGGTAVIMLSESLQYLIARKLAASTNSDQTF
jgi:hypothetical protein